jgi:hypothetical protein
MTLLRIGLIGLGIWIFVCLLGVAFVAGATRLPTPGSPRWLRAKYEARSHGDD